MEKNVISPKNQKLIRGILYIFSLIMLFYSIYTYLIPHKVLIEDVEYIRNTGQAIEMDSEVSLIGFIFSFGLWSVLPFYIGKNIFPENSQDGKNNPQKS